MNIWETLKNKEPFFALAPMEDVTDTVFRQIILSISKPDILFTEFTNVEGLLSEGGDIVKQRLIYSESEKPLIAQIWGLNPAKFYEAAKKISGMGFDGIDINMGCPVKKIVKMGACSALIENPSLAKEIILATQEGAGDLPVSVKTRVGFKKIQTEEWIGFLLEFKPNAMTVHGRIAVEMSNKPNNWEEIKKAVELKNTISPTTVMLGNGDVLSRDEGISKANESGVDGIMVGRGIFQDPWLFDGKDEHSSKEKIQLAILHIDLFIKTWQGKKDPNIMKKFFKMYINGFDGAAQLRNRLMSMRSLESIRSTLMELV